MANYMAEVAKMLGVELGEEFYIKCPTNESVKTTAVFSENGFRIVETNACILTPYWKECTLHSLLKGDLPIQRKPWKPSVDERYYSIAENGFPEENICVWDHLDIIFYKLGNCYRTREEAEANRDKWVAFYASDEVLEV